MTFGEILWLMCQVRPSVFPMLCEKEASEKPLWQDYIKNHYSWKVKETVQTPLEKQHEKDKHGDSVDTSGKKKKSKKSSKASKKRMRVLKSICIGLTNLEKRRS